MGRAIAFGSEFAQLQIEVAQEGELWWLQLDNPDVDLEILLPTVDKRPLVLNFHRLRLPRQLDAGDERDLMAFEPAELLDAEVSIQQLYWGEVLLGNLHFSMSSHAAGLRVEEIEGNLRGIQLGRVDSPLVLVWLKDGSRSQSFFNGGLLFKDFGDVLERWGYERIVESEDGLFDISLSWPGRPDQWQLADSKGQLLLDMNKGRFITDSGTATLKVVGVLNFANLMRRLRLDFSDLFDEGVSFDGVDGAFRLGDGQLQIVDTLDIKSPASRFQTRGSADLNAQTLDMELVATLPVAQNLPWMAALAGGLPAAAGVYVASKVFKKTVDQFSSAVYSIRGDWNEPKVKFQRMFSDKTGSGKGGSADDSQWDDMLSLPFEDDE